jgi:endoglucanase
MPLQILQCFEKTFDNKQWSKLLDSSYQFILASSPEGFSPDWIEFDFDKGLQFGQNIGSYNAIRVYLWGGMLNSEAKFNVQLKTHLQPMVNFFIQNHFVPTEINVVSLDYKGQGDMGFLASILPLVHTSKNKKSVDLLLSLIDEKKIIAQNNYYQHALSLFALGWYHQKYRFLANGCLQVPWKNNEIK